MEKLKKALTIASLSALGIAIALLIAGVFGLEIFSNKILLKILLTAATIAITSGMAINEIAVIKRKRILGFVGLALLLASATLAIILFIVPSLFANETLLRVTGSVALSSLLFVTIISYYSKMESSMIGLQIAAYLVFIALDVMFTLMIWGVKVLTSTLMIEIFSVLCILAVGGMIALTVLSSKRKSSMLEKASKEPKLADDKMIISKAEYYTLKEENLKLKEELEQLKKAE